MFWGLGGWGDGIGAVERDAVELEVGRPEPGLVHHLVALPEDEGERDRVERHRRDAQPPRDPSGPALRGSGSGFRVQGLGFRVWGFGFGVWGLGFRVEGSEFRVQGLGIYK